MVGSPSFDSPIYSLCYSETLFIELFKQVLTVFKIHLILRLLYLTPMIAFTFPQISSAAAAPPYLESARKLLFLQIPVPTAGR